MLALPIGAWRSPASALAWGARGRRFKSSRPDTWEQSQQIPSYHPDMAVFFMRYRKLYLRVEKRETMDETYTLQQAMDRLGL